MARAIGFRFNTTTTGNPLLLATVTLVCRFGTDSTFHYIDTNTATAENPIFIANGDIILAATHSELIAKGAPNNTDIEISYIIFSFVSQNDNTRLNGISTFASDNVGQNYDWQLLQTVTGQNNTVIGSSFSVGWVFLSLVQTAEINWGEQTLNFISVVQSNSVNWGDGTLNFISVTLNNIFNLINWGQQTLSFTSSAQSNALNINWGEQTLNWQTTTNLLQIKTVVYSLASQAITEFTNFNFKGGVLFNNKTLLFNENGIYEYTGFTDDNNPIPVLIQTGKLNFGSQHRKKLPTSKCYVNAQKNNDLQLTVTIDNNVFDYFNNIIKEGFAVYAFNVGRGCDGVFWQLALSANTTQQTIIESIEIELQEIRRRVK